MSEPAGSPYLSIIIPTRNDNRGGDLLERLRTTIHGLIHQSRRHGLNCELIIVEWNPEPQNPPVSKMIEWPESRSCSVRVITVAPEYHSRFANSDKMKYFGAAAFNVGIRRARGRFVLTSTVDLLYSDQLIQFLAKEQLHEGLLYRIDRRDVRRDVLRLKDLDQQLAFSRHHLIDVHQRLPFPFSPGSGIPDIHLGAPGDFILLSRDRWWALKGMGEFDILGVGIDALLCFSAVFMGALEKVLPSSLHLYHVDHDSMWQRSKHPIERAFYVRLNLKRFLPPAFRRNIGKLVHKILKPKPGYWESRGVTHLNSDTLENILREIAVGKRSPVFNDDSWGLAGVDLPETLIPPTVLRGSLLPQSSP
jgi:hypothetical protein